MLANFILFSYVINFISFTFSYPDSYKVKDAKTNKNFDLMDLLDPTINDKEHRRESEDPLENWDGRWFPAHPNEPPLPPKILGNSKVNQDNHISMGPKSDCDDGKTNLTVDWDYSSVNYTCFGQKTVPDPGIDPLLYCQTIPKHYKAMHKCMSEKIEYSDDIPLYGTHRPVWPVYGEYKFLPRQRWLHSLEHGAVVMLYHPCANNIEVGNLKKIVKSCLRKHVITPYNLLDDDRPLALLTWGCRLTMSMVDFEVAKNFIQEHALQAPEGDLSDDGFYNDNLIKKAEIVSDEEDSSLCSKKIIM